MHIFLYKGVLPIFDSFQTQGFFSLVIVMAASISDVYLDSLLENVDSATIPDSIDVVIGGGALNGFYGLGTVTYLRRLVRRGTTSISRVSGTSIGGLLAASLLSPVTELDWVELGRDFEAIQRDLRKGKRLGSYRDMVTKHIKLLFPQSVPGPDKLFVTYWDSQEGKTITRSAYRDHEDLVTALVRSAYIPFLSSTTAKCEDRYFDGVMPHMFPDHDRPVLYVSLLTLSKSMRAVVSGEANCLHRVMSGVLDASTFFVEGKSDMCSWANKWGIHDCLAFGAVGMGSHLFYLFFDLVLRIYDALPQGVKKHQAVAGTKDILSYVVNEVLYRLSGGG